jgi:hypothetical protein
MTPDGKRPPTGVAGCIGAAATQQAPAGLHRDNDIDPVVAQLIYLRVLVRSGHEEDDGEDGQSGHTGSNEDLTDPANIDLDARPAECPDPFVCDA